MKVKHYHYIEPEQKKKLQAEAKRRKVTESFIIRELLKELLSKSN